MFPAGIEKTAPTAGTKSVVHAQSGSVPPCIAFTGAAGRHEATPVSVLYRGDIVLVLRRAHGPRASTAASTNP
jgi:hypothetical protein